MTMVYLASPYSSFGDKDTFMDEFMRISGAFMVKYPNLFCVSPLFNHFSLKSNPDLGSDWDFWKEYSTTLLSRMNSKSGGFDFMLIANFKGAKDSVGVQGEIEIARQYEIPIFILDTLTLEMDNYDFFKLN